MTPAQFRRLEWFVENGARGRLEHSTLIMANKVTVNWPGLLAVMHLVAQGAIDGEGGYLKLTDYGRRVLEGRENGTLPL